VTGRGRGSTPWWAVVRRVVAVSVDRLSVEFTTFGAVGPPYGFCFIASAPELRRSMEWSLAVDRGVRDIERFLAEIANESPTPDSSD